jgi:hypothetical protein
LHIGLGDDGRDEDSAGVDADVTFDAMNLSWRRRTRGPATGDVLTEDESTTAAVGGRRRPDQVPTTPEKGGAEHSPELFDTL